MRADSAINSIPPLTSHLRQVRVIARRTLLTGSVVITLLSGCGFWSSPDPEDGEAKEIKPKDAAETTDAPEAELVAEGKRLFEARMYSVARESFQSLKERYPFGAYATFADIKVADTYFYNGEYNEAAKFYEGFIKNYPASPDLPYVELQAARSHINSSKGAGRDRQPLERALTILDSIVTKYPDTSYAHTARRERAPVVEQLAAYDRLIIAFYEQRENAAAVAVRERQFKERWGARMVDATLADERPEAPLSQLPRLSDAAPASEVIP